MAATEWGTPGHEAPQGCGRHDWHQWCVPASPFLPSSHCNCPELPLFSSGNDATLGSRAWHEGAIICLEGPYCHDCAVLSVPSCGIMNALCSIQACMHGSLACVQVEYPSLSLSMLCADLVGDTCTAKSAQETARSITEINSLLHAELPAAHILSLAVLPKGEVWPNRCSEAILTVNAELQVG